MGSKPCSQPELSGLFVMSLALPITPKKHKLNIKTTTVIECNIGLPSCKLFYRSQPNPKFKLFFKRRHLFSFQNTDGPKQTKRLFLSAQFFTLFL